METVMTRIRAGMFVLAVVCLPVGRAQDTACEDVDGWKDQKGKDCYIYGPSVMGICANRTFVEDMSTLPWWPDLVRQRGWNASQASQAAPTKPYMEENANGGMDASQACCDCGGGRLSNTTESNIIPSAEDAACEDMNGWKDSVGNSCSNYVTRGTCENGTHHWVHDLADFAQVANNFAQLANSEGVDALQACCGCGGGLASTMDTTQVAAAPSIHSNLAVILAGVVGLVCLA